MPKNTATDEFAARIIRRTSAYLTACAGVLLAVAVLVRQRQSNVPDVVSPTLLQEFLALVVTLVFIYTAIWCAGFLAVLSVKQGFRRQNNRTRPPADSLTSPLISERAAPVAGSKTPAAESPVSSANG